MANVVLGVCGGIAAYKSAYLASLMSKNSLEVKVVMTENACKFITPLTFKTITKNHVYTSLWSEDQIEDHTSLSIWADLVVIAPATANTMAKMAHGFADNLLTSIVLDYTGSVFVFPAMHENMWKNTATIRNVEELTKRGMYISKPDSGDLAGGKKGIGRMNEPEDILNKVLTRILK